jgi:anti-sigma factor (TIGR02949 family)
MNCKTAEIFLYNYLDNELTEQEAFEVEEHLKSCTSCRNLYNYESEFHKFLKSKIKENTVKAPIELRNKILTPKKLQYINYNFFTLKGLASVSIIFVSIIFISKVSMGYSTVYQNYESELKSDIKIVSNNEKKLTNWMKSHNYNNLKLLNFNKKKINMTPLGLGFSHKKPLVFYHYKGNRIIYQNIKNLNHSKNSKKLKINDKTFFLESNSNFSIAVWKNKNGTTSLIASKIPENQLKTILYTIK